MRPLSLCVGRTHETLPRLSSLLSCRCACYYVITQLDIPHIYPRWHLICCTDMIYHMLRVYHRGPLKVDVYTEIGQKLWGIKQFLLMIQACSSTSASLSSSCTVCRVQMGETFLRSSCIDLDGVASHGDVTQVFQPLHLPCSSHSVSVSSFTGGPWSPWGRLHRTAHARVSAKYQCMRSCIKHAMCFQCLSKERLTWLKPPRYMLTLL